MRKFQSRKTPMSPREFIKSRSALALFCAGLLLVSGSALPCTTLFLPQSSAKVVAKNLDWPYGQGLVYINKRDVEKRSVFVNSPQTPLAWTSRFASVTFSQTGREFPWEGMNEAGVSVDIMELDGSSPQPVDARPAINALQWIQFILDTSSSTADAIANARRVRITGPFTTTLHFMVCDRSGACAVFENVAGWFIVHAGLTLPFAALANDTYDQSILYLRQQLASQSPQTILTSRSPNSLDRFARAALLSRMYQSSEDPIVYAFNALDNVHEPALTQWNLVFSLVPRTVLFRTLQSRAIKEVDLLNFDPRCSSPVMMFNINAAAGGNVSSAFVNYNAQTNARLVNMSTLSQPEKAIMVLYPETTKCLE